MRRTAVNLNSRVNLRFDIPIPLRCILWVFWLSQNWGPLQCGGNRVHPVQIPRRVSTRATFVSNGSRSETRFAGRPRQTVYKCREIPNSQAIQAEAARLLATNIQIVSRESKHGCRTILLKPITANTQ